MSSTLTSNPRESDRTAPTERKTLVFFVGTDPEVDPGPLQTAQHFAAIAAGAGLPAQLRLAARSVRRLADVPAQPQGVEVTVCPRAIEKYDISRDQVDAIGGRVRPLAEILTEVAEGTSVLIPVTHSIDDPREA
ncbi:MAG: hypothetical protein Q8K79_19955 [Solirubrobacteraceae bacterium]|nr:hypothetical protein [Solirubrobacteraceae bacterium]